MQRLATPQDLHEPVVGLIVREIKMASLPEYFFCVLRLIAVHNGADHDLLKGGAAHRRGWQDPELVNVSKAGL
jgi:hypothetical protein